MSFKVNLKIDWCSHDAAKFAVMNWHYSKRMPVGKLVKIGAWENDIFIGCVIFSHGNCGNIGNFLEGTVFEVCELTRIALTGHISPVSQITSIAIKLLKRQCPGLKAIISFADPEQGHTGKIYQAGNWVYIGESGQTYIHELNGVSHHSRSAGKHWGRATKKPKDIENIVIRKALPKYKYVYPLTKEMRIKVEGMRKDYPASIV